MIVDIHVQDLEPYVLAIRAKRTRRDVFLPLALTSVDGKIYFR